ncbi:MAG TPA: PAS domain S-box protein [Vicinamibacterales bacterium]|nr:PAS domain S-box protein [Vicinamibacterales bacterium]
MPNDVIFVTISNSIQVAGALIFAATLRHYERREGRAFLRFWVLGWISFAVFVLGSWGARQLSLALPATSPARVVATLASLSAGYCHALWLLAGTYEFSRRVRLSGRWVSYVIVASVVVALVTTLAWIADPAAMNERYLARVGVRSAVAGLAFVSAGVWLWLERRTTSGLASRLLPIALMLYGLHQPVLVFWSLPMGGPQATPTAAALQFGSSYLEVFLQLLIGLGMLLWMLEVERERRLVDWRRLTESEERYRMLAETATDAIVTVDELGCIVFANGGAGRTFGYTPDELIGRPLTDLMPEAARAAHREAFARYRERGDRRLNWSGVSMVGRHRSGREIPIEISLTETTVSGERRFTGIARDVSDRKRMEAQLMNAQRMEGVGRLAGGIAHDFNNLLTAIGGYADLSLEGVEASHPMRAGLVEIRRATSRAADLTGKLLAFSRRQRLAPRRVDVNGTITDVHGMLTRLIGADVSLTIDLSPTPVWVDVDPGMLEQVLLNLAINARDAMPRGGRLSIETRALEIADAGRSAEARAGHFARIAVTDTGSGISPEHRSQIFDPFFTTKDVGRGTGLGLAIAYGVIRQHEGWIEVESEVGAGTTFCIFLPISTSPAETPASGSGDRAAPRGRERVLLVEDDEQVRRLVSTALERYGYDVIEADSAPVALEKHALQTSPIDLLITDVVMPGGMSGAETVAALRRDQPGLPVVLMSGYHARELDRKIPNSTYLAKPFAIPELLAHVRRSLDRSPDRRRDDAVRGGFDS